MQPHEVAAAQLKTNGQVCLSPINLLSTNSHRPRSPWRRRSGRFGSRLESHIDQMQILAVAPLGEFARPGPVVGSWVSFERLYLGSLCIVAIGIGTTLGLEALALALDWL